MKNVLKMSWRRFCSTSWKRMAKTNIFLFTKTSSEDVRLRWAYSSWTRRLEDVFWRRRRKSSSRRMSAGNIVLFTYSVFVSLIFTVFKIKQWIQKKPPEVFCEKRCSWQFRGIHRKTPVPESFSKKFIKKETLAQMFSCEFWKVFKSTTEHLWTTASVDY